MAAKFGNMAAIFHPRTSSDSNACFRTKCALQQYSVLTIQHLITCDYMQLYVYRVNQHKQEFVQLKQ